MTKFFIDNFLLHPICPTNSCATRKQKLNRGSQKLFPLKTQVKYARSSWDPRCPVTRGFTFQNPLLWHPRWADLRGPNCWEQKDEQYHRSCNGNKDSLGPTSTSSPLAVASLSRTTTLAILASLEPRGSSLSAMTHRTRDVVFLGTKREKSRRILTATTGSKRSCGCSLTWPKSTRGERKYSVSLLTLAKALCFPHSWQTASKRKRKGFVLLRISVTLSLSALVKVGITLSCLAENKKKKKRCSLSLSLSLSTYIYIYIYFFFFFGPNKKIK